MALKGIDPILTGPLLAHLDAMGHSDSVVIGDANFPAHRLATRLVELPGLTTPDVVRAIRTVVPLDDGLSVALMSDGGPPLPVQDDLVAAADAEPAAVEYLERQKFYDAAAAAYLVVRTGEERGYANAIIRKGFVGTS